MDASQMEIASQDFEIDQQISTIHKSCHKDAIEIQQDAIVDANHQSKKSEKWKTWKELKSFLEVAEFNLVGSYLIQGMNRGIKNQNDKYHLTAIQDLLVLFTQDPPLYKKNVDTLRIRLKKVIANLGYEYDSLFINCDSYFVYSVWD